METLPCDLTLGRDAMHANERRGTRFAARTSECDGSSRSVIWRARTVDRHVRSILFFVVEPIVFTLSVKVTRI